MIKNIHDFNPQNIANSLWACANLKVENQQLLHALAAEAIRKISEFQPQHMSNTLWACATLRFFNETLLDAIAAEAIRKISDFDHQGLSNMAWALAKLFYKNHQLMDSIAAAAIRNINDFNSQDLANTAWAFACLGLLHAPLLDAISAAAIRTISDFAPQCLSNIAWAWAGLLVANPPLLAATASAAIRKITHFHTLGLSNTASAFDQLTVRHVPLFDAISAEALSNISELSLQELSTLVDVGLRDRRHLEMRLGRILFVFLERMPSGGGGGGSTKAYMQFLKELQVDSFGLQGSRFLLARRDIGQPPVEFKHRAWRRVEEYSSVSDSGKFFGNTVEVHKKAFAYLEHALLTPAGPLEGAMLKDNGIRSPHVGRTRWLSSTQLPINASVDRNSCAEFQALSEVCDLVASKLGVSPAVSSPSDFEISGGVRVLICGPSPCLSCLSAMFQFKALLPRVALEVVLGRYQVVQT